MLLRSSFAVCDAEWAGSRDGETAVIMGNGNSLKDVPRELLEKYPTFGANHIYLMQFQPNYFVCVDSRNLLRYAPQMHEVAKNAEIAFLSDAHLDDSELYQLENVYLCNEDTIRFPGEFWWTGGTVAYAALKIAYAMGFRTVLLVGCDRDKDWKHFSGKYPGEHTPAGRRDKQRYHLGMAQLVYDEASKRIINLSPPSDLDEFIERGRIEDWL
jgi:hypothetical protein